MNWTIEWRPAALQEFMRFDRAVRARIDKRLRACQGEPARFFKPLRDSPLSSMRVGDYRVLAVLVDSIHIVRIEKVGHRSTVYDR